MINMEVEGMTKRRNAAAELPDYRGKEVDTGELETIRDLRSNMKIAKWLIPVLVTLFLGFFGLFGWLAKRALVAEIREIVAPIERKLTAIETKVNILERRVEKIEDKR